MIVRKYKSKDIPAMIAIWNEVVEDGIAFPQEALLDEVTGSDFFSQQSHCGVAESEDGSIECIELLSRVGLTTVFGDFWAFSGGL